MSKRNDVELPAIENRPAKAWDLTLSAAVNLGVATLVLTGIWTCLGAEAATTAEHRLRSGLFAVASAMAATAWIAGSEFVPWKKGLLMTIVLGGTAFACLESDREFELDERVVTPGRIENGQFVDEGLGLAFDVIPNCNVDLKPHIFSSVPAKRRPGSRSKLLYGQAAVVMSLESVRSAPKSNEMTTSIHLRVEPYLFRPVHGVQETVRNLEASYAARPGIKILAPTHIYRMDRLDLAEFDIADEPNDAVCRHLFARSGPYLLCFVMVSRHGDNRPQFDRIARSLRISRRPTGFLD